MHAADRLPRTQSAAVPRVDAALHANAAQSASHRCVGGRNHRCGSPLEIGAKALGERATAARAAAASSCTAPLILAAAMCLTLRARR